MLPDYYKLLNISTSASQKEVKFAYRKLAKELHPDKHIEDNVSDESFKIINEAYQVLSNHVQRQIYDQQRYLELTQHLHRARASQQTAYRPRYAKQTVQYKTPKKGYTKWAIMYGKIFVTLLILFVILFPISIQYFSSTYYYNTGIDFLKLNESELAIDNLHMAIRSFGGRSAEAAIKCGEIMLKEGRDFEALNYATLGLTYAEGSTNKAKLHYIAGIANIKINKIHKASEALEKALFLRFDADSVYKALAPLYAYELKNYHLAIQTYDSLLLHEQNLTSNYIHRGFCLQKIGNHESAILDFNNFIKFEGVNGSVQYLKGVSMLSLSDVDSACYLFRQAYDLNIRNARTFIILNCPNDSITIKAKMAQKLK